MRLLIDTNDNTDVNNIYLPETALGGKGEARIDVSGLPYPLTNVIRFGVKVGSETIVSSLIADTSITPAEFETYLNTTNILDNSNFTVRFVNEDLVVTTKADTNTYNGDTVQFFIRTNTASGGNPSIQAELIINNPLPNSTFFPLSFIVNGTTHTLGEQPNLSGFTAAEIASIIAACINGDTAPVTFTTEGGTYTQGVTTCPSFTNSAGTLYDAVASSNFLTIKHSASNTAINDISFDSEISFAAGNLTSTSTTTSALHNVEDTITNLGLTPILATINQSRKTYYNNNKLYIKGFGGFIGVAEAPVVTTTQADFFGIAANTQTVNTNKGIGFNFDLESMVDGTHFYMAAYVVSGDGIIENDWSVNARLPAIIRIARSGSNLLFSLCTPDSPFKSTGFTLDQLDTIATIAYEANHTYEFLYPRTGAEIAQVIKKNVGSSVVDTFVNIDATATLGNTGKSLNNVFDDKTFTLFHVFANDGADAVITNIVIKGD